MEEDREEATLLEGEEEAAFTRKSSTDKDLPHTHQTQHGQEGREEEVVLAAAAEDAEAAV